MPPLSCSAAEVRDEADALKGWLTLSPGLLATVWCTPIPGMADSNARHLELQRGTIWLQNLESPTPVLLSTDDLYLRLGHRRQGVSSRGPLGHAAGCQWALQAHSGWKPLISSWCWLLPVQGTSFPRHRVGEGEHGRLRPKPLGLDICGRHGGFLAEQPKKMSRRQGA